MMTIAMVVLLTPLLTASIVAAVAHREDGTPVPWLRGVPLLAGTAIAVAVRTATPFSLWLLLATFVVLFLLTFPVTNAIAASATTTAPNGQRTASLEPRRFRDVIPLSVRAAVIAAELAALVWLLQTMQSGRRDSRMLTFTGIALVFFLLYEAWQRQEFIGVRSPDERERKRRVRTIFAAQSVLTISFLCAAALSVHREALLPILIVTALLGVAGCAFALSTGVQKRYLEKAAGRL